MSSPRNLYPDTTLWPCLRGEVAFHVDRGHFPIQGTITFEEGSVPEISIECG